MSAVAKYVPADTSVRIIRGRLTFAERCEAQFGKVRTSRLSPAQANGVRYENKVHKALTALGKSLPTTVEHNPWFRFKDDNGFGSCSPDAILWFDGYFTALVVEVKYTWVPTARVKFENLYAPVLRAALGPENVLSLIICHNLTPDAPKPIENIGSDYNHAVYQWLGRGGLVW